MTDYCADGQSGARTVAVRVPASTSNLGSGFDCCGLALKLYLSVKATTNIGSNEPCQVVSSSEGNGNRQAPRDKEKLIYRAMRFVANREGLSLSPVHLTVHNDIPFASGLGSSGAAIAAGIALCGSLCGQEISPDKMLRYATELEGHADNVAAALLGGLVINCITEDGNVLAVKQPWPAAIKVITVSPDFQLETKYARSILPQTISRHDLIYNLQRVALFGTALATENYELLWEAMQDRIHQAHRAKLVPGLPEALATPRLPGLLGIALSGSGPSVVALAADRFEEIGLTVASAFHKHQLQTTVRILEVDSGGLQIGSNLLNLTKDLEAITHCSP